MLDDIALKYGTDKSSNVHNYTRYYERHFKDLKNNSLKILEIGVQNGKSLKMWKEYFSKSEIYGVDINNLKHLEEDRITIFTGSQSDNIFLENVNNNFGPFDIVIDDGSHLNSDMIFTLNFFIDKINPGGFYITEDLHCCYWDGWCGNSIKYKFTDYIKELIDKINAFGKTGMADVNKDINSVNYKNLDLFWEREIESVFQYRSIVFIKRKE